MMTTDSLLNDERKVIVHILNGLYFGGNENLCLQLIKNMQADVFNVVINLDPSHKEMMPLFRDMAGVRIEELCIKEMRPLSSVVNLCRIFKQSNADSVIIYSFANLIIAGLAARIARIRRIACRAGNPVPDDQSMRRKWKTIIFFARFLKLPIYACSGYVHDSLALIASLPDGSAPVINGCDVHSIGEAAGLARKRNKNNAVNTIGMIARLDRIKDHETLIRAFDLVSGRIEGARLWIIGDGKERQRLESLVEDKGLKNKVFFFGDRADVPELLGQIDIFVFSTTADEGFGMALVEAMSSSIPVIASDVPSCREILDSGNAGFLIKPFDATAMSSILEKLLLSQELRTSWGRKAYERAISHYDIKNTAKKWHNILIDKAECNA